MLILAMSDGRGGVVAVEDGRLLFALDAGKAGRPRHAGLTAELVARAADRLRGGAGRRRPRGAGPGTGSAICGAGAEADADRPGTFFGHRVRLFSSSHERSHTMCAYGLAPPGGAEYYAVVRERGLGAFHRVGDTGEVTHLGHVPADGGFEQFRDHAARHLTDGLPLLVSGSGGLDGEWNRRWRDCGLFPSVFVPPCPDDTGSALGTAIDAQWYYTCAATLSWDLGAGEELVEDADPDPARYDVRPFAAAEVAAHLAAGGLVGWARGRYELGPRRAREPLRPRVAVRAAGDGPGQPRAGPRRRSPGGRGLPGRPRAAPGSRRRPRTRTGPSTTASPHRSCARSRAPAARRGCRP